MNLMLLFLVGYFLGNGTTDVVPGPNYIHYHRSFAAIEEMIVQEEFQDAASFIDSLFEQFEVKFAKDYVIAAQISLLIENTETALNYLRLAMEMGVKLECLQGIPVLRDKLPADSWQELTIEGRDLRTTYLQRINLDLYQELHRRYQQEQDAKGTRQYRTVVYSNFNRIKEIIEDDLFPGEDLIGIDNETFAGSLSDCSLGNSRVIVTLLHYDYPVQELGQERLVQAITNGHLHPREFATIYSFQQGRASMLYGESEKEFSELAEYCFNFPFGSNCDDLAQVNADRWQFGICSYEVDQKKREIGQKYGMQLIFNYR